MPLLQASDPNCTSFALSARGQCPLQGVTIATTSLANVECSFASTAYLLGLAHLLHRLFADVPCFACRTGATETCATVLHVMIVSGGNANSALVKLVA